MLSNESSPEIKFAVKGLYKTHRIPIPVCCRQLKFKFKLVLTHVKISLPLSQIVGQLGPRLKAYNIVASSNCRIKLNVKSPTALILPTVWINLTLHSVVASDNCRNLNNEIWKIDISTRNENENRKLEISLHELQGQFSCFRLNGIWAEVGLKNMQLKWLLNISSIF